MQMYQRDFCTVERDERDFLVCQEGYYDIRFKPFGNTDSAECSQHSAVQTVDRK